MLPFFTMADALFAVGVVSGVSAFAGIVWALAWRQRPAAVAERVASAETAAPAPADAPSTAAA